MNTSLTWRKSDYQTSNASFSGDIPILLHLDASPRGDRSITRRLTHDFALAWKQAHPRGQIIYRDLGRNPVPLVTETFIAAVYTPPAARSPELRAAVAISDQLISERGKREREQYLRPIREEVQRKSGSVARAS